MINHVCLVLQALDKYRPVVFFLTHGESSTGVVHPVDGIGDLCHKWDICAWIELLQIKTLY